MEIKRKNVLFSQRTSKILFIFTAIILHILFSKSDELSMTSKYGCPIQDADALISKLLARDTSSVLLV